MNSFLVKKINPEFKNRLFQFLIWGGTTAWLFKQKITPFILDGKSFDGRSLSTQVVILTMLMTAISGIYFMMVWVAKRTLSERQWFFLDRLSQAKTGVEARLYKEQGDYVFFGSKTIIRVVLALIFFLNFFLTPYWLIPRTQTMETLFMMLIVTSGAAWSFLGGRCVQIRIKARDAAAFLIMLAGLFLLNFNALNMVIPWRGDEGYHISKTLIIAKTISTDWLISVGLIFLFILILLQKKPLLAAAFAVIHIGLLLSLYPLPKIDAVGILRYPFFSYWLIVLAPKIAMLAGNPYHEILFRLVPFFSATAIVWYVQRKLECEQKWIHLLWGFSMAVIPIVYFYSSILYLEMPAVFLMLIVSLNCKALLTEDLEKIRQTPAWYALIFIGLIKETVLPFLFTFLFMRAGVRWFKLRNQQTEKRLGERFGLWLKSELITSFVTLFPALFYLVCRSVFINVREYSVNIPQLLDLNLYQVLGQSLVSQFGIFFALFVVGLILLIRRKDTLTAAFLSLVFVSVSIFFMVDIEKYVGYSRFNLNLLPVVLAGAAVTIRAINRWRRSIVIALAFAILSFGLIQSAVYQEDGKLYFGRSDYFQYSGYHYPYDEVLTWLKANHKDDRILFTGMFRNFYLDFYFNKLHWFPDYQYTILKDETPEEVSELTMALDRAEKEGFDIVVYHVVGDKIPQPAHLGAFHQNQVFKKFGYVLLVFTRVN